MSCDPLYDFTAEEIRSRIEATHETVVSNARAARDEFVWREIESPEHLGEVRLAAMRRFLDDFPQGLREKRYLARALPKPRLSGGRLRPRPLLPLPVHLLRAILHRLSPRLYRGDVPGRGRSAGVSAAPGLRKEVAAPATGGRQAKGAWLPRRGHKGALRVAARRRRDARGC